MREIEVGIHRDEDKRQSLRKEDLSISTCSSGYGIE